ncbi:hypothetical protein EXU57_10315 [Segetibacter sp. 3557_3]|uniref:hypothetical protein n=1 Tax=Segetibacter sp. 3557_3 TaxID=2547429 RepID=UPI0010587254|nr:hypothetical protein [Segetibacter sp. 3557_3]TDH26477.1 hypothetical protein EXU57_10315 [Segetibacter sp. 3557_3]
MENDHCQPETHAEENQHWYTEDFIATSIVQYLKENGFRIHKDSREVGRNDKIITASRFFTKEVIGIRGLTDTSGRDSLLKVMEKNNPSHNAKAWLTESLFNSLVNFGKYYSDDSSDIAMALPNVDKYKAIIERVQEYFAVNQLSMKVYLVNKDGQVEISNLNVKHK